MWIATPDFAPDHQGPSDRPYTPFGAPGGAVPMVERLHAVARRAPAAAAVIDTRGSLSYGALWDAVTRFTASIKATATGDAPVAILLNETRCYLVAMYACLAAGRIAVLLDAGYPETRNRQLITATRASLIIAADTTAVAWPGSVVLDVAAAFGRAAMPVVNPAGAALRSSSLDLDQAAFVLCTSGSTGAPKAIAHSQRTMWHWARAAHDALHITPGDRLLSISSASTLGGFTGLLAASLSGAAQQYFDLKVGGIAGLQELLRSQPITILRAAPSLLRGVATLPDAAATFARLRAVQTYGEPLRRSDALALRAVLPRSAHLRTTYGSTEASGLSWFVGANDAHDPLNVAAGALLPDTTAALIDENGQPVGVGAVGELVIRSPYNALGEWRDGCLHAGRLETDPHDAQQRIFRTGDLAYRDAAGVFVVVGRKDRMLNVNGQRVEPAEIEEVLRRHGEVAAAEVVTAQRHGAPWVVAFVVPRHSAAHGLEAALRQTIRSALPAFMMPGRFVLIDSLPLLPGGKVDLEALRLLAAPPT